MMAEEKAVTYLVLAHGRAEQFGRLAARLTSHPATTVVVHIDDKADERPFRAAVEDLGDRVHFVSHRSHARWAGYGMVRAMLDALREAINQAPAAHYLFISGSDYPIRPAQELIDELRSGAIYMNSWAMPCPERGKPLSRLEHFYWAPSRRNSPFAIFVNRQLKKLPKRHIARGLGGRDPFAGSTWLGIPHEVAVAVLDTVASDTRLVRFFRFVENPDESFFQTVIASLPHGHEVRPNLTYTDWSRPTDPPGSPVTLTADDLPAILASGKFFARKFDFALHPSLLEHLDRVAD